MILINKKYNIPFIKILSITLTLLIITTNSFAQTITPKEIEQDLLHTSSIILPYYYGNFDSLFFYSSLFSNKITTYVSKYPSTLSYPFQKLIDSNHCNITTSTDGLFRIYSWDTWLGGTMHFFKNIFQYKSGDKVYSKIFELPEGDPSCFYSQVFTLKAMNKTYYLAVGNGIYSSKDASQSLQVFSIENNSLNNTEKLFKTQKGLTNMIDLNYDFFSVVDRPERPVRLIKYDSVKQIIYISVIAENGKVNNKLIEYKFNGQYFEQEQRSDEK